MKKLLLSFSLIALTSTINAQWISQGTGFFDASRGLSQIHIVDANTVWALAYDGAPITVDHPETLNIQEFTKTVNGTTWASGTINVGNPLLEINNISPVSATTAWVSALIPADGNGVIYKTSDGGDSWTQQLETGFQTTGSSFLNGVYFFNESVGIAYGDPVGTEFEVYRTVDGGDNWTPVTGANIPDKLANEYGYNNLPVAAGGVFWFPTSKGRIFKTTDMGVTWTATQAPIADFGGYTTPGTSGTLYFSDALNGYLLKLVGTTYTYAITTSGGASWSTPVAFTGTRRILNYIPGTTIMAATSQADPVGTSVSTNNGVTWDDLEPGGTVQRGATDFLNISTGWSAGFSDGDPLSSAGIYKLSGPLATEGFENAAKFKVYPNPATSTVTIFVENVDSYNLSITDLTGKVVMVKSLNGIESTLDISSLSTGAYFFELSSDNKKDVVKILKN